MDQKEGREKEPGGEREREREPDVQNGNVDRAYVCTDRISVVLFIKLLLSSSQVSTLLPHPAFFIGKLSENKASLRPFVMVIPRVGR